MDNYKKEVENYIKSLILNRKHNVLIQETNNKEIEFLKTKIHMLNTQNYALRSMIKMADVNIELANESLKDI